MTSMLISSSAASDPTYTMLRSNVRWRSPSNDSTHKRPNGMPMIVMPSRISVSSSGHEESAGPDCRDVFRVRRRIQRDDEVDLFWTGSVSVLADSNLVPGRETLNV